jgi:hypothetical protein
VIKPQPVAKCNIKLKGDPAAGPKSYPIIRLGNSTYFQSPRADKESAKRPIYDDRVWFYCERIPKSVNANSLNTDQLQRHTDVAWGFDNAGWNSIRVLTSYCIAELWRKTKRR